MFARNLATPHPPQNSLTFPDTMSSTDQSSTSVAAHEAALETYSELWFVAVDAFDHRKGKASAANREFRTRHQAVQKAPYVANGLVADRGGLFHSTVVRQYTDTE
ncbi:hypothetical protein EDC01DRAFT_630764 [Geopyxis carbonaria]|nr:hypothetical protein EDC01DRAFT_630764 [Geopyxis carbonaria]